MDLNILQSTLGSLAADPGPFKLYTRGGVISFAYLTRPPIIDTTHYHMLQLIGCTDPVEGFPDQSTVTIYVHLDDVVGVAMEMREPQ